MAQKYPKLGNLFASPVRTGRVGNDNMGDFVWKKSRRGRICPQFFYFSLKICEKNNLSLFEKGCFYYYIMFPAETKSHKIFRIQAFQFRQNETSIFADEHIIEPNFTAAVFRCLDTD